MEKKNINQEEPIRLFICYSRSDYDIAIDLVDKLEKRNIKATIDVRDLPFGEEFKSELSEMIGRCDTVIWLLSPTSAQSRWCQWELSEVTRMHKRLIPVRIKDVDMNSLQEPLSSLHTLPPIETFNSEAHLNLLIQTLETDISWVKEHTRLTGLAIDWNAVNRTSGLLRGAQLRNAEEWLTKRPDKVQSPNADVIEMLQVSRKASIKRVRLWMMGAVLGAGLFAAIAIYATSQSGLATSRGQDFSASNDARASMSLIDNTAQYSNWRAEGVEYIIAPDFKEPLNLLINAVTPYVDKGIEPPIILKQALRHAINKLPPWEAILKHEYPVEKMAVERNGERMASLTFDGSILIWNLKTHEKFEVPNITVDIDDLVDENYTISWCGPNHLLLPRGIILTIKTGSKRQVCNPNSEWLVARSNAQGTQIAVVDANKGCEIWSTDNSGKDVIKIGSDNLPFDQIHFISWNTQGNQVVFAGSKTFVVAQNLAESKEVQQTGRFIGWSQIGDHFCALNDDNVVCNKVFSKGSVRTQVPSSTHLVWPDALDITDVIDMNLVPGDDADPSNLSPRLVMLSPDLEYVFALRGDCNMGNAGGGCESVQIDVYNSLGFIQPVLDEYEIRHSSTTIPKLKKVRTLYGHISGPTSLVWHPSGKKCITSASRLLASDVGQDLDCSAIVWSVEDGRYYPRKWGKSDLLSFGDNSFNIAMWSDDQQKLIINWTDDRTGVNAYAFSESSTYTYSINTLGWEKMEAKINMETFVNKSTKDPIKNRTLNWANKGNYWHQPTDGEERHSLNRVAIINSRKTDSIVLQHPGFVPQARWSPDGKLVMTSCLDGYVRIFNAKDGKLVDQLGPFRDYRNNRLPVDFIDWSPDGKWILMTSRGAGEIGISLVDTASLLKKIKQLSKACPPQGTTKEELKEKVNAYL